MTPGERSTDLYEQISSYPKPPLVPLPTFDDFSAWQRVGFVDRPLTRLVLKAYYRAAGLTAFQRRLPEELEDLLRHTNTRGPALFAPVISASLVLKDDPRITDPLRRAATLVLAVRDLHDDVMSGRLEPDCYRGQVLEMGQYPNLFSTSTIVENKRARVFKSTVVSRIAVLCGGRFFIVEIGEKDRMSAEELAAVLEGIAQSGASAAPLSPGILTCATHVRQVRAFHRLGLNPVNAESLEAMRHTLATLCLDLESAPGSDAEAARLAQAGNPRNRWFQSSLQLVVFGNARGCAICNFSAFLDGNTMMRGTAEIQRRAATWPLAGAPPENGPAAPAPPRELQWEVPPRFLQDAERDFQSVFDGQQATFAIPEFGRRFFSEHAADPVPAFILALQMTGKRLTGRAPQVWQFLSMSRYRCMDLSTAMVTTPEVLRFIESLESAPAGELGQLLRQALHSQVEECRRARRCLPVEVLLSLYLRSVKSPLAGLYVTFLQLLAAGGLRLLGLAGAPRREVIVSHPEIYPEVPLVGRPGVRLPYVKYFGLHYQIFDDRIVLTMMPGVRWPVPNGELVAALTESLERLRTLLEFR
ncbi:MAG: choline/carnitine O-acyltransferase [Bryobacterales bacterium]|nr:choline/carnitine O-acyltransferase [Bryobacterales bacterium]